MRKDYSEQVSKMSYGELSKGIEEGGKSIFIGSTDEYRFFTAMWYERYKRDEVEKEFLSRKPITRFELMEL